MRWEAMMEKLRAGTIQQWFADFTDALYDSQVDKAPLSPILAEAPTPWPPRPAITNGGARYH
jgi:trehalose 6-phosphate synthase